MSTYHITFSPTGGTQKVADLIAKEFPGESHRITLIPDRSYTSYAFEEEDLCIFSVPSFGGRVPETAVSRIRAMEGNGAACVLVCVYGNRAYEDTLLELKDTVKEAGFFPIAAMTAIAEHSIMHQYAAGRPDASDAKMIREFAAQIREKSEKIGDLKEVRVPGKSPYQVYNGVPFVPKADRKCNNCGRCVKECPVSAIDRKNPKHTDEKACISCMRCVAVCPNGGRKLNGILVAAAARKMAKAFQDRKKPELFLN